MRSSEALRSLKKRGIEITTKKATGHVALFNPANGKRSELPIHGNKKELGTGLWKAILRQLGLE